MVINAVAFVAGLFLLFQCRALPTPVELSLAVSLAVLALVMLNHLIGLSARHASTNQRNTSRRKRLQTLKVSDSDSRYLSRYDCHYNFAEKSTHWRTVPVRLKLNRAGLSLKYFLFFAIGRHVDGMRSIGVACLFAVAGFLFAWAVTQAQFKKQLPDHLLNRDVVVNGQVVGAPEHNGRRLRFLFRVTRTSPVEGDQTPVDRSDEASFNDLRSLVRLNWYGGEAPPLQAGDRIQMAVKLRAPSGFLNPGGFDYEKWLFQSGIVATGYVRQPENASASWQRYQSAPTGTQTVSWSIAKGLMSARIWLTKRVREAASERDQRGVILALAVGDRTDIEPDQWQLYIATGTNHLLAISGLHITLVATAAGMLGKLLWLHSRMLQRIQRQTLVLLVAAVAAFVYAAMAGFAIPTQRALIMFMVLAAFVLTRKHHQRSTALSIALILVAIWNPFSVLSAGFWMSFCAVAMLYLIYSSAPRKGLAQRFFTIVRGHLLITLGLYPATVLLFQQASLVAPVANFISVPLVGVVITPIVFLCALVSTVSVPLAAMLLVPVDWLLGLLVHYLGAMANLPFAVVHTGQVTLPVLMLVTIAVGLSVTPCHRSLRWLLGPLMLPLIFSVNDSPQAGNYRVTFLDVGQGSAVVVRTANRVLAYDTGAQFSSTFNAADAVIIPFLQSQRIDRLDALVVSHSDSDHSGGVDELLASMEVDRLWHSQPLETFMTETSSVKSRWCESGIVWHWDRVSFEFLHPSPNFAGNDNNLSCVLQITSAGGQRTLLTGDIELEAESLLLPSLKSVDILMTPHHGSLTSSGVAFVASAKPKYVVHTVGYNNRFGFPRPEVVERYHAVGATQLSTADSGAVTFDVGDGPVRVQRYRAVQRKIWNRPAGDVSAMTATLR